MTGGRPRYRVPNLPYITSNTKNNMTLTYSATTGDLEWAANGAPSAPDLNYLIDCTSNERNRSYSIAVGEDWGTNSAAVNHLLDGSFNIGIGYNSRVVLSSGASDAKNRIMIGSNAVGRVDHSLTIGGGDDSPNNVDTRITKWLPGSTEATDIGSTQYRIKDIHMSGKIMPSAGESGSSPWFLELSGNTMQWAKVKTDNISGDFPLNSLTDCYSDSNSRSFGITGNDSASKFGERNKGF